MRDLFIDYLIKLYGDVPSVVYKGLASIFCLIALVLFVFKGYKKGIRPVLILLLIEYSTLIFSSTVLFREYAASSGHNFSIFWSYKAIIEGQKDLIVEDIMNVITFIPVGLLLPFAFRHIKWWQVALIGLGMSLSIETLQYLFHRGFSELDDVIHNTLGCMIGGGLVLSHRKHR